MTKTFAAVAISAALIVPALAQDTWYVVQDTTTKRCSVVKERRHQCAEISKLAEFRQHQTGLMLAARITLVHFSV